jgi:enamine deaminase RidA (YjgF/YER057c/UK114 family)
MKRTSVYLVPEGSRGMPSLEGRRVPAVFCDAVRVELTECVLLHVSGVMAMDEQFRIVGTTMREQTRQVLENIKRVVEHEGGTLDDVVRVRVYVTRLDPESLREIHEVRAGYFTAGKYPASTLVQVSGFVREGGLIEIDADAVLPRR